MKAVVNAKIDAQADYIVWRDSTVATPSQRGKMGGRSRKPLAVRKSALPAADPGDVTAHRWRKRFTKRIGAQTGRDEQRITAAKIDASHRAIRICEQVNSGTGWHTHRSIYF